jgi:hypothetical protein
VSEHDVTDRATGKPRRMADMCATCIMRPAVERIALSNARINQFINEARRTDAYVVCHSTIPGGRRDPSVAPAICRGFSDAYSTNYLRIMERLGGFVDVDPDGPS